MSLAFLISIFNAQHVSDVNISILRSLRLICWIISCVVLLWYDACWCYVVVWLGWCGVVSACCTTQHQHTSYQSNTTHEITQHISRKLLRMDVLTSETCWAVNKEIKKASDIKLVSLYSSIKMVHGPINIRFSKKSYINNIHENIINANKRMKIM